MSQIKIYSTPLSIMYAASSITVYGGRIAKMSKLLKDYPLLENLTHENRLKNISQEETSQIIMPFVFEGLIDSIKIGIFFENYIKGQILLRNCIVHSIDYSYSPEAKKLANEQKNRPITIREIHAVSPFKIDANNQEITNEAIKETTLSYSQILNKPQYKAIHNISEEMIKDLNELNKYRNELHFHDEMSLSFGPKYIESLKEINLFIDNAVNQAIARVDRR